MAPDAEFERSKRVVRLRIARLRRRIDGRVHGLQTQGRRLTSWKTYVSRYPGCAVLAALGLGLATSAGLRRGGWSRMLGLQLARRASRNILNAVFAELGALWSEAAPDRAPDDPDGADHGRS
jgi:hypothetical protein